MPAQFDWNTEDEKEWSGLRPEQPHGPRGLWPYRRLRRGALVIAIVVLLAVTVVSQVGRLVDSRTNETELAVRNGHRLVLDAAFNMDGDLLEGLILDRFQEWTSAQKMVTEHGLLLDRSFMDLHLANDVGPNATEVDIDPVLREAVVTTTLIYQVGADEQRPEAIRLSHVFSYRYFDERWLLNPPTTDFWGPWLSTSGRYLTLNYPERDAQIGRRLAADLEAILGHACNSVEGLNCQSDMHLEVNLVADPTALYAMSDPVWRLIGGRDIGLPAPTLIGIPVDEAAYRTIYQAYADRVVTRLIAEQTNLVQMSQPLLAEVIMDRIVSQLGLQSWPRTFKGMTSSPQTLDGDEMYFEVETLWNQNASPATLTHEDGAQLFSALVEFLVRDWSEMPEVEMLRLLDHATSLQEWLNLLNPNASYATFNIAWDQYVAETLPGLQPILPAT